MVSKTDKKGEHFLLYNSLCMWNVYHFERNETLLSLYYNI